jgi:hypothetical protein
MSTGSDLRRASRLARSSAVNARKTGELAMASGEVIARRVAMGADALGRPSVAAVGEAVEMISEKGIAMTRSGMAAAQSMGELTSRCATLALEETAILGRTMAEVARCRTPMELAWVQGQHAYGAFGRLMSQGLTLATLAAAANGATLAPFHTAATANARRLRK